MTQKKRKNYSGSEKVSILRKHLIDHIPVSNLCDQYEIHPTMFYRWQKDFFENGQMAFEKKTASPNKNLEQKIATLEAKLTTKNEVLAELMEEHLQLKKNLGEL